MNQESQAPGKQVLEEESGTCIDPMVHEASRESQIHPTLRSPNFPLISSRTPICTALLAWFLLTRSFYWKTTVMSGTATWLFYTIKVFQWNSGKRKSCIVLCIRLCLTILCGYLSPLHLFVGTEVRDRPPIESLLVHEPVGGQPYVE